MRGKTETMFATVYWRSTPTKMDKTGYGGIFISRVTIHPRFKKMIRRACKFLKASVKKQLKTSSKTKCPPH